MGSQSAKTPVYLGIQWNSGGRELLGSADVTDIVRDLDRTMTFRTRTACPGCAHGGHEVVWTSRFDVAPIRGWLDRHHYEADLGHELRGHGFSLVRCTQCQLRYQRRVLDDRSIDRLYSEWISAEQIDRFEEELFGRHSAPRRRFELARQQVKHVLRLQQLLGDDAGFRGVRLIDFGCGDGGFVRVASDFGFDAYGVDFSASRRERAGQRGLRLATDLEGLDEFGVRRVDAITMFETLEHLVDPMTVLGELYNRIRPGGVLVVEVPDASGMSVPRDLEQFNDLNPLEHVTVFEPDTLQAMCANAGFEPIAKMPAHVTTSPVDLPRTLASRIVRRASTRAYFRRVG